MTDAYILGDWKIYFVEKVFKPLFCEIRYLVYVWTTPNVYALMFTVTNKPRRAGYAVFTCIMYDVKCIILVTIINAGSDFIKMKTFLFQCSVSIRPIKFWRYKTWYCKIRCPWILSICLIFISNIFIQGGPFSLFVLTCCPVTE